jgi:hypothetical protein
VLSPRDDAVARAVLLILQTIAAPVDEVTNHGWRISPDQTVLSDSAAMEYLRTVSKPLVCEVIDVNWPIEIRCGPPEENPRWTWWAEANQIPALSPTEMEEMERTGSRRLLLVGDTESIVLTEAEVEQFTRDYIILGNYTTSSFIASRLDPSLDVAVVWRYWRSTNSTRAEYVGGE